MSSATDASKCMLDKLNIKGFRSGSHDFYRDNPVPTITKQK